MQMPRPLTLRALPRSALVAGIRVALVAALLIAILYVAVAAALDAFVARRVLWEVDQRLTARLSVVETQPTALSARSAPDDVGTDGAPVYVWWVSSSGRVASLTVGSPRLPAGAARSVDTPLSLRSGPTTYRFESSRFRGGLLVAAQDLAAPSHVEEVLLVGELVIGPVLVLAVLGGVLLIGVRAAAPVEAARRRLQELTADASHELRTPLTVIEAEIELARSAPPDPVADREALEHVARESRRLATIVEDLLWLARFDAAPPAPARGAVDLRALAASGAARFAAVAGARGITLDLRVDGPPAWIEAPAEWVDRLIGTLVDNACRYAPAGGTVQVSVEETGGRAVLRVEDDGPGVPEAQREGLFDRFHRATDQPGGAGLGLAIADSVVRSTAGRWRIDTSSLGGALFEVWWRRAATPPDLHEADPRREGASVPEAAR